MAIIRSYGNPFEIIDRTPEINSIPNTYGIIGALGIFGDVQGLTTRTLSWEDITHNTAIMQDAPYGGRSIYGKDSARKLYSAPIPHYPLDFKVSPEDVQGKTAYGTNDQAETVAAVVARKLETAKRSHDLFLEVSRAKLIEDGSVYAPNGTISHNFYTDLGVTRKEIDFVLGTAGTDVIGKIEETIAYLIDNSFVGGLGSTGMVTICSPEFFTKLINHPKVQAAYTYYASTQEPLRNRLGSNLPMGTRVFEHGGMKFVEYRGLKPDGTAYIGTNEARVVPTGMFDVFQNYAAPALKMDTVNTIALPSYAFQYADSKGNGIEIETESNIVSICKKPQLIIRAHSSN